MSGVRYELSSGMKRFLASEGARSPSIRIAFRKCLRVVQREARNRHNFTSRTGQLERAIDTRILSESPLTGEVYINPSIAPHGVYQHQGTKPHFVEPVHKKALRWSKGDKFFFSKGHMVSGIEADPFLEHAVHRTAGVTHGILTDAIHKELWG